MKMKNVLVAAICVVSFASIGQAAPTTDPATARAAAKDAYIFTYPLVLNYRTMYAQAIKGEWLHLGVSSPKDTDIVTPNLDSPYSYAWLDLRAEPWVLTLPKVEKDRFITSQWDDLWGFVLDNPGSVEDGNDGVTVMLASPSWKGEKPRGVKRVIQGESDFLGTLTRTQLMPGKGGLGRVKEIQQEYKLEPLSKYLGEQAPPAAANIDWPAWKEGDEKTEEFWKYVAFLLPYVTPKSVDAPMYEKLAAIGIERGKPWEPSALDSKVRDAIKAGVEDAQAEIQKVADTPGLTAANFFGDRKKMGTDYLDRTMGVYMGIFGNVSQQSFYFSIPIDSSKQPLDGGKHSYTLTFAKDQIPPVKFFWSVSMYNLPGRFLVANPIDRYSISSATPGLKTAANGSITLYISAESPGKDKESNWLPAPKAPFWMVLRTYGPGKSIVNGSYKVPPVKPVK
jgi:hypothetical protein